MNVVMKQYKYYVKCALLTVSLALSDLVSAQEKNSSDYYLVYEPSKIIYYEEAQSRLFIQKDSTVSKDYIVSLLGGLTDSDFEISWIKTKRFNDNICRVVVDDTIIDSLIVEVAKDDAVLMARRIFEPEGIQQEIIDNHELENESTLRFSYSQRFEIFFFNDIVCFPIAGKLAPKISDSLCNELGLTVKEEEGPSITFSVSKIADIFQITHSLLKTELFYSVYVEQLEPFRYMMPSNSLANDAVDLGKVYYNVTGVRLEKPSGPTIVITHSSDGTVRSDKILFDISQ